jgi:uncharacterized protein YdeI (YjbR/CyaY-like superfamily)
VGSGDEPTLPFETRDAWESWLAANHWSASGVWIRFGRKGSGVPSVTHAEALEVALCYGWIDARSRGVDELHWVQRFTPRSSRSTWSKVNREKAAALIERGAMRPAGLREVERARADGRWDAAYEPQSTATVPDDLREALDRDPEALAFFESLDSRNRYAILHRLQAAKRPETRARRLETFVTMLSEGRTIH